MAFFNTRIAFLSLVLMLLGSSLAYSSGAAPNPSLKAFLGAYMPNTIINASSYINESVGAGNFVIMQLNSTGTSFIVINATNARNYSFALNSDAAALVLRPYLVSLYYPSSSALAGLSAGVQAFRSNAQPAYSDCLFETGDSVAVCSASTGLNTCLSSGCQTVPVCNRVLNKFGPSSAFAYGVLNFSLQYQTLNSSYQQYFSLANGISEKNVGSNLAQMGSLLSTILSTSRQIPLSPLFPSPTNMSPQQLSTTCAQYGSNNGPWYCYAVGFCESTYANYTALTQAQSQINSLLATPVSNSSIAAISSQAASNAYMFFLPVATEAQQDALQLFQNTTAAGYNSLAANMSFVVVRYSNASLADAYSNLTSAYNAITAAGGSQNFTKANATYGAAAANALIAYKRYAAPFLSVYGAAFNSTALVLIQELNYRPGSVPYSIASLASEQASVNAKLQVAVSANTLASLSGQISPISSQAKGLSAPLSFELATKSLYGGFVSALIYGSNTPASAELASAPLYAPILPIVVGLLIIFLIYVGSYYRLSAKKRIRITPKVKRAWLMLFIVLLIIVGIAGLLTYVYASGANSFMPVSGFLGNEAGSNSVYILENISLSGNQSVAQCAASIAATMRLKHKTYYFLNYSGDSCQSSSAAISGAGCYNRILASEVPAILLTPGNSTISFKGFYGDTLYASGSAINGGSCMLNTVLRAA